MKIFPTHYQSTHILYMLEHIYIVGKLVISLVYQSVNVTHAHTYVRAVSVFRILFEMDYSDLVSKSFMIAANYFIQL